MFYSAIAEIDATRKTASLENQCDPAYWHVVAIAPGMALHFALLNEQTDPLGRIICALTQSPVYHVETELHDDAPRAALTAAESRLGLRYDYYGALRAWDNSGVHTAFKEFCSGMAQKIINPMLPGIQPYPNPGRLLTLVSAMLGLDEPKQEISGIEITGVDLEYLDSLVPDKIATGNMQQILEKLGV